jgi:predicted HTH domain antitoxin
LIDWIKDKELMEPAVRYKLGKLTLGQAAREANVSIIRMIEFLMRSGYRSKYSIEDFKRAKEAWERFSAQKHTRSEGK